MDDPIDIVNAALDQHTRMIKEMKGVPGIFSCFLVPLSYASGVYFHVPLLDIWKMEMMVIR